MHRNHPEKWTQRVKQSHGTGCSRLGEIIRRSSALSQNKPHTSTESDNPTRRFFTTMWTPCACLVAVLLALCAVHVEGFCGETPPVWRNGNITCPARAVCADVFETERDWYNGTRCEEKRTLHNCMCPGGTVCPYNDPAHRIFATSQQHQYICEPVCQLPFCNNVRQNPNPDGRVTPVVSITAEQRAAEFGQRTYYRMECRCPRHAAPYTQSPGLHRAVKAYTHRYNFASHRYSTLYVCNGSGNEGQMSDPCSN